MKKSRFSNLKHTNKKKYLRKNSSKKRHNMKYKRASYGGFPDTLEDQMAKERAITEKHYINSLDTSKSEADKLQTSIMKQLDRSSQMIKPDVNIAKSDPRYTGTQLVVNKLTTNVNNMNEVNSNDIDKSKIINAAEMSQTGVPSYREQYHMTDIATRSKTTLP